MSLVRALYAQAANVVRTWTANEVVRPLLEPVLHPSRWRIRALGLTTALGHPLFYWIWGEWLPQPYENLGLRLLMSALGFALLVFPSITALPTSRQAALTYTAIFWITLPLFFWWMYFCNGGNPVWLATTASMYLIYYHLTDWRIATVGSIAAVIASWLLFSSFGPDLPPAEPTQVATAVLVIAFSWFMALVLGLSSSNLRREQLTYTLGTMGIMAHELRTPLATMSLIGDAVRSSAAECDAASGARIEKLAVRLHTLVRNMNHQIDMQIANARLMRLPSLVETVSAGQLVRDAVNDFPYRSTRERECVVVRLHNDFVFRGSRALFSQVLDNLLKNALRSLAAATSASQPGDLAIDIGTAHGRGRIAVTDQGVGIAPELQPQIFQPFFSTDHGAGHGLGLAFCERVIGAAHGTIKVRSAPLQGAVFTIELPLIAQLDAQHRLRQDPV